MANVGKGNETHVYYAVLIQGRRDVKGRISGQSSSPATFVDPLTPPSIRLLGKNPAFLQLGSKIKTSWTVGGGGE